MFSKRKFSIICMALALAMFAAGCKKKVPAPAPPPPPPPVVQPAPPPPAAPTVAQFTAEPTSIQRGQTSTLRWEVTGNVTSVSINQGVGTVQSTGSSRVNPSDSTTYTLTATGPGGSATQSATVNVSAPPPPPPPAPTPPPTVTIDQALASNVQDAYFDYDKTDIRSDASATLSKNAAALKTILNDFANASIVIEGHCDERGSAEYNLGLGAAPAPPKSSSRDSVFRSTGSRPSATARNIRSVPSRTKPAGRRTAVSTSWQDSR